MVLRSDHPLYIHHDGKIYSVTYFTMEPTHRVIPRYIDINIVRYKLLYINPMGLEDNTV